MYTLFIFVFLMNNSVDGGVAVKIERLENLPSQQVCDEAGKKVLTDTAVNQSLKYQSMRGATLSRSVV